MSIVGGGKGERLAPYEMVYYAKVRKGVQTALELQQQAQAMQQQATSLQGAHDSYLVHLCETYGLRIGEDQIDPETGVITRAAGPATRVVVPSLPEPAVAPPSE
jgi:hypothetical protein